MFYNRTDIVKQSHKTESQLRNSIKIAGIICLALMTFACSNQKNTKKSRLYHDINTRYNIYFNAEIAYEDALKNKNESYQDNLSQIISMYPTYPEEQEKLSGFETTIDKCVKAIKMHSIQAKPEKDPKKRRDIKYQEWFEQKEFNPFLKNVWLLMAKAEYQSLDYVRAISTFSYITRLFKNDEDVVAEANLWMANAYAEMGWTYEVENVFHKIKLAGGVPKSQENLYAEVYANYLIKNKQYQESIPYLQKAIKSADGKQTIRLKYLLGQIYSITGKREAAFQAFQDVQGMSTPHLFSLNAKLQQATFVDTENAEAKKKALSSLNGMTGKLRNEEFLDQIYYAIGNIHWASKDTTNAIKNYHLAIDKSTRAAFDKAIAQVKLGDIYFDQKNYVKAQPLYPEALGVLGKKFERYNELSLRSEVLDELVVYAEALHLQDSLQTLARMSEDERLIAINKIIEIEKQKEKDEQRRLAEEEWKGNNPDERPNMVENFPSGGPRDREKIKFYFYNSQAVAQGKTAFKRIWGNRKLEDNWRRQEKGSTAFDSFIETAENSTDSISDNPEVDSVVGENIGITQELDRFSVEYYLPQIPLTPAKMAASNAIVEDAYYQMANIYKTKLGDLNLSIEAYTICIERFPHTKNKQEIYYQLFLIYSQLNNKAMADLYRNKLLSEFSEGDYAIMLSDPDYEWNLRNINKLENDLYNATYEAYLSNNINRVRNNYSTAKEKYPLTTLMPKFMFVNALTYAQTNEPKTFTDNLKELVEKYPDSDVAPLAGEILKGIISGKLLVAGGAMRGMVWDIPFAGDDFTGVIDTTTTFIDMPDAPHRVLLLFDTNKTNKNDLLYDVANYNFSNFILKTFDISFSEIPPLDILQIQGLSSLNETADYVHKSFGDSSLVSRLDSTIIMIPISDSNYTTLTRGRSLGEYIGFVESTYSKQFPELIAYWRKQMMSDSKDEVQNEVPTTKPVEETTEQGSKEDVATEKIEEDVEPVLILKPKDKTPVTIETEKVDESSKSQESTDEGLESVISDETIGNVIEGAKDVNKTVDEIMNNPVDGIKNLLNKSKNKPKLTKEERAESRKEKELQKQLDKEKKAREKAAKDSIASIEKQKQDSIKQAEKELIEMEKAVVKAKEDARKSAIKDKEDARKAREQELKEKERTRREEAKLKEKQREEKRKQREQELKEKERARKEVLKQREQEREEKRKQRERELREKRRNR